ncbi:MAG: hypothetical protein JST85_11095 [Acidobacteria bacterium]|nr:hypothetical protein [Acidobacteriota bacterium]
MKNFRPRTMLEYVRMLWRRKLIIVLFSVAIMIAAYNSLRLVRNVYEASALVAISIQTSEERSAVDVQVASVNQHLLSRANLEPIIRRYRLYNNKDENVDSAIEALRKDVKVETKVRDYYPQFPISFTITYKNNDPVIAMQVTNDLISYFNNSNDRLEKQNADEANALDGVINELEERLKQINKQRAATEALTGNLSTVKAQRTSLLFAIENLNDKEFSLNQHIAQQKRQITEQEKITKALPSDSIEATRSSAYGVLLTEKARLEAQLKEQRSQYTEKNQKVIQTQAQLTEINKQLIEMGEKRSQAGIESLSPEMRELRGLQRELASLETDLELVQREVRRKQQALALLPDVDVSMADVASSGITNNVMPGEKVKDAEGTEEYNLLFNRYSNLLEKRDSFRRLESKKGEGNLGLFQIVDKATLPTTPVGPNRGKLLAIAIAMALGVAIMAALVIEAPRLLTIQDENDIEYLLGTPVVGLIPETLTATESRRNRKLLLVRLMGILLLAVVTVPAFSLLLKKVQIFQLLAK